MTDHRRCPPQAHDTSSDGAEPQAVTADGRLARNDCHRPIFWCETDGAYHHRVRPEQGCFLIAAETGDG